jgi:AbrB family looped-hinge helix DNA binding protein
MTVTIDRSGRLVVPKAIRDEAGIRPGDPLRIRVRDGRIELDPGTAKYRTVVRHGIKVAEAIDPMEPMSREELRRWIRGLRERRIR